MNRDVSVVNPEALPVVEPATRSLDSSGGNWSDWIGMIASLGCAIHCAAMPFVIAYLPALGLSFLADEAFHKWMAVACFGIAMTAFYPGLRKHGRLTPVVIGSIGLLMISTAAFGFSGECCAACDSGETANASATSQVCTEECCPHCASEDSADTPKQSSEPPAELAAVSIASFPWMLPVVPWLTPLGGMVLVCAHMLNRRYGCLCGCCSDKGAEDDVGDTVDGSV